MAVARLYPHKGKGGRGKKNPEKISEFVALRFMEDATADAAGITPELAELQGQRRTAPAMINP